MLCPCPLSALDPWTSAHWVAPARPQAAWDPSCPSTAPRSAWPSHPCSPRRSPPRPWACRWFPCWGPLLSAGSRARRPRRQELRTKVRWPGGSLTSPQVGLMIPCPGWSYPQALWCSSQLWSTNTRNTHVLSWTLSLTHTHTHAHVHKHSRRAQGVRIMG